VAGYLSQLPMNPKNTVGSGTDLVKGERLYHELCADCHGEQGEGIAEDFMPLIQGQHYPYLMRQFEWIANGKRRNSDPEMFEQVKELSAEDTAAIMDYTSRLSPAPPRLAPADWKNPDFDDFVRMQSLESTKTSAM
jgi:cytochrome c553